jgi:hypothetical protein
MMPGLITLSIGGEQPGECLCFLCADCGFEGAGYPVQVVGAVTAALRRGALARVLLGIVRLAAGCRGRITSLRCRLRCVIVRPSGRTGNAALTRVGAREARGRTTGHAA